MDDGAGYGLAGSSSDLSAQPALAAAQNATARNRKRKAQDKPYNPNSRGRPPKNPPPQGASASAPASNLAPVSAPALAPVSAPAPASAAASAATMSHPVAGRPAVTSPVQETPQPADYQSVVLQTHPGLFQLFDWALRNPSQGFLAQILGQGNSHQVLTGANGMPQQSAHTVYPSQQLESGPRSVLVPSPAFTAISPLNGSFPVWTRPSRVAAGSVNFTTDGLPLNTGLTTSQLHSQTDWRTPVVYLDVDIMNSGGVFTSYPARLGRSSRDSKVAPWLLRRQEWKANEFVEAGQTKLWTTLCVRSGSECKLIVASVEDLPDSALIIGENDISLVAAAGVAPASLNSGLGRGVSYEPHVFPQTHGGYNYPFSGLQAGPQHQSQLPLQGQGQGPFIGPLPTQAQGPQAMLPSPFTLGFGNVSVDGSSVTNSQAPPSIMGTASTTVSGPGAAHLLTAPPPAQQQQGQGLDHDSQDFLNMEDFLRHSPDLDNDEA